MGYYYRNECADCGKFCIYEACQYYKVLHKICDECNYDVDHLYEHNDDHICSHCYEQRIFKELYEAYKKEWCRARNISLKDIDEEVGINGECYVCYDEFWDNEGQDDEYIQQLAKDYGIEIEPTKEVYYEEY